MGKPPQRWPPTYALPHATPSNTFNMHVASSGFGFASLCLLPKSCPRSRAELSRSANTYTFESCSAALPPLASMRRMRILAIACAFALIFEFKFTELQA
jgi:hypothetical protein